MTKTVVPEVELNPNSWHPDVDRNQGSFDDPVFWMTRDLADGWRVAVRLYTDQYRTVIDRIHFEASDETALRGIRGRVELPTGDAANPTWQRYRIATLRREASEALEAALRDMHRTSTERQAAQRRGEPLPAERRETIDHTLAFLAAVRGFNIPGTHPIPHAPRQPSPLNLAILAAAYADAVRDHPHKARQATKKRLDQIQRHYAPSTLGPLVAHARTDGLLTPTSPGKAGGKLTPKARRILTKANFHAPWYAPENPAKRLPKLPKPAATVARQSPTPPTTPTNRRTRPQSPQTPPSS